MRFYLCRHNEILDNLPDILLFKDENLLLFPLDNYVIKNVHSNEEHSLLIYAVLHETLSDDLNFYSSPMNEFLLPKYEFIFCEKSNPKGYHAFHLSNEDVMYMKLMGWVC